jgi:hypothetical protein
VGLRELGTRQLKDLSRPERIYQVEAADLEPLLAGLTAAEAAQIPDLATAEAAQAPDVGRITCGSGSARRDRAWVVPRRMEVDVGSGAVRLDFRQAVIAAAELRIDANIESGTLTLITRPGIVVDADDLTVRSGSVRVVPPAGHDAPVELRVKVCGRVGSGSVWARPAHGDWWRAMWRRLLHRRYQSGTGPSPRG